SPSSNPHPGATRRLFSGLLEAKLAKLPKIVMPAVTLDGASDGSSPPTDGTASAKFYTGRRVHHVVPRAGHNLPQETPKAFVNAVLEVAR
ncbi:alpha/beta fold hydrolase, partial [Kibdelosporangium philippinense]